MIMFTYFDGIRLMCFMIDDKIRVSARMQRNRHLIQMNSCRQVTCRVDLDVKMSCIKSHRLSLFYECGFIR